MNIDEIKPSAWFNLPSTILFERDNAVKSFLARCAVAEFDMPANREVSRIISKALACAHESLRRSRRGELYYAQSLLERVRSYIIQMEDWIVQFEPVDAQDLKLEKRITPRLQAVLKKAYPPIDSGKIEESLISVCSLLSDQIVDLHNTFSLERVLENDTAAVELVLKQQVADAGQK